MLSMHTIARATDLTVAKSEARPAPHLVLQHHHCLGMPAMIRQACCSTTNHRYIFSTSQSIAQLNSQSNLVGLRVSLIDKTHKLDWSLCNALPIAKCLL